MHIERKLDGLVTGLSGPLGRSTSLAVFHRLGKQPSVIHALYTLSMGSCDHLTANFNTSLGS